MDRWMYLLSVHVACSVGWRWMDVLSVHIEIGPQPATLSVWPLWRFGAKLVKCSMCWHLFVWLVSCGCLLFHIIMSSLITHLIEDRLSETHRQCCSNKVQQPLIHSAIFALPLLIFLARYSTYSSSREGNKCKWLGSSVRLLFFCL